MIRRDREFIAKLAAECEEHLEQAAFLRRQGLPAEAAWSEELAQLAAEQALRVAEVAA